MQPHIHQPDKAANPVAGLLSVKVPALGKKRGLPNWKVWRPFWVTAKRAKCPTKGVRGLQLSLAPLKFMHVEEPEDRISKVFIPCGSCIKRTSSRSRSYVFALFPAVGTGPALVYLAGRSESESQRWMHDLVKFLDPNYISEPESSQFEVTALPSPFSMEMGLSGVMGLMGVRPTGVALRAQSSESENQARLLGAWGWKQIDHARCRLAAAALPEDDGKICVIRTTSLFPNGAGDLTVFCAKGRQLVKALQTKTASLLAALQSSGQRVRRMSRSEGDLRFAFAQLAGSGGDRRQADAHAAPNVLLNRSATADRSSSSSVPNSHPLRENSSDANNMLLATRLRSHSERKPGDPCEQTNTPCSVTTSLSGSPPDDGFSDDDLLDNDEDSCCQDILDRRRVSNVSIASGVYETIDDDFEAEKPVRVDEPPPLPPREYKLYGRRRPGGLHAFLKLQRLWRSNSENHVAREEDEEVVDDSDEISEVIYSELCDPIKSKTEQRPSPEQPALVRCRLLVQEVSNLHHSNSCSNLDHPRPLVGCQLSRSANCMQQEGEGGADEPLYMPMNAKRPDRKRINSESAASFRNSLLSNTLAVGRTPEVAISDENIYVTMSNAAASRKQSLTSELYALVTGIEPSTRTSGP